MISKMRSSGNLQRVTGGVDDPVIVVVQSSIAESVDKSEHELVVGQESLSTASREPPSLGPSVCSNIYSIA